jgi:hypothetical protein
MSRMPNGNLRKVFLVVAGGHTAAERHFEDTIQRKRTLDEVRGFLPSQEIEKLEKIYHGSSFITWGAVPGPMNESRWEKMTAGDVVLIYNMGRIRSRQLVKAFHLISVLIKLAFPHADAYFISRCNFSRSFWIARESFTRPSASS